ncbi:MAG: M12 family metallo-peptidase [Phycisphaerae bacterium]
MGSMDGFLPGRLGAVAVVVGMMTLARGALGGAAVEAPTTSPQHDALVAAVNEALGLYASEVVSVPLDPTPGAPLTTTVSIGGTAYTLDLMPHSVRAPGYEVRVQQPDGSFVLAEPAPIRTLRGHVVGVEGATVVASLLEDGLYATVRFPDGAAFWIEPIADRISAATPDQHVVYRSDDVIPGTSRCGMPDATFTERFDHAPGGDVAGGGNQLFLTELACDSDVEYTNMFGGVTGVQNQINAVINAMNNEYENDVQIRHVITTIVVRTSEPDPYTSSISDTLLCQFITEWTNNQQNIQRDVAKLFTGKNIAGGIIGQAAAFAEICDNQGFCSPPGSLDDGAYCYSQNNFNGIFGCKTDLAAHELGHLWGAFHCNCTSWTMNPFITCANQFHPSFTQPDIIQTRNAAECLDLDDSLASLEIVGPTEVMENTTVVYEAVALFNDGTTHDVAFLADWSVIPSSMGTIDGGVYTAAAVDADTAATIFATVTIDGITVSDTLHITVLNGLVDLAIIDSNPPNDAIDARQPSEPDGGGVSAWDSIELIFNDDASPLTASDLTVTTDPPGATPQIVSVSATGNTLNVQFDTGIPLLAWTRITHNASDTSTRIGFLPGDVNNDGVSNANDVLHLIDCLNGVASCLVWQCDADRSQTCNANDILRVIDLLNGAGVYDVFNGAMLPD